MPTCAQVIFIVILLVTFTHMPILSPILSNLQAEDIFSSLDVSGSEAAVVVDPPRRGCPPEFLVQLAKFAPQRIVYVACSPDTQVPLQ